MMQRMSMPMTTMRAGAMPMMGGGMRREEIMEPVQVLSRERRQWRDEPRRRRSESSSSGSSTSNASRNKRQWNDEQAAREKRQWMDRTRRDMEKENAEEAPTNMEEAEVTNAEEALTSVEAAKDGAKGDVKVSRERRQWHDEPRHRRCVSSSSSRSKSRDGDDMEQTVSDETPTDGSMGNVEVSRERRQWRDEPRRRRSVSSSSGRSKSNDSRHKRQWNDEQASREKRQWMERNRRDMEKENAADAPINTEEAEVTNAEEAPTSVEAPKDGAAGDLKVSRERRQWRDEPRHRRSSSSGRSKSNDSHQAAREKRQWMERNRRDMEKENAPANAGEVPPNKEDESASVEAPKDGDSSNIKITREKRQWMERTRRGMEKESADGEEAAGEVKEAKEGGEDEGADAPTEEIAREKRQWMERTRRGMEKESADGEEPTEEAKEGGEDEGAESSTEEIAREKRQWRASEDNAARVKRQWRDEAAREKRQWSDAPVSRQRRQWIPRLRREDTATPVLIVDDVNDASADILPALEGIKI